MPSYGQTVTLEYWAWDASANTFKTGDVANHTLRWVKDGTSAAPANSPSEIDSTNAPGVYKLTLTASEASCQVGTLCGKSATANVVILGQQLAFENLPTASPAASGGLPTVGSGSGQLNPSGGAMPVSDKTGFSLATPQSFSTTGSVGSVTGSVGSVTGSVGSIAGVTFPTNFATLSIDSNGNVKLVGNIKKNAALNGFTFYMALSTDHYTAATGKSITATRSIDGAAFGSCSNSATEIGSGWYAINLAASDLNGNTIAFSFSGSGCDTTLVTLVTTQ